MDPLIKSSPKLPSLRTYAKDLEHARKEKNLPADTTPAEAAPANAVPVKPRKKEPLITATSVPKPKLFASKQKPKEAPTLKPIPAKKPLPKLPTFTASDSTTFITDNEDAAAATIITDTKRDRFKLVPSIITSIKKWFTDQKKARAVKNAPKYTVPETTRRKGVIQKATSTTGKSATADFASIQERIKQRKAQITKPEPHTTWSANTEPVFLLLEGEVAQPITNVQLVSRKSFRTQPAAPVPSVASPTVSEPLVPVIVPTEEITPTDTPAAAIVEAPEPASEVREELPTNEIVYAKETSTKQTFLNLETNLLALSISGVALVLIAAVTFGYVVLTQKTEVTTSAIDSPAALLQTSSFSVITDTTLTKETIIAKVASLAAEPAVISEFVFSDSAETAFTPQDIITTLEISAGQNFAQAVRITHFGYVANTEPYLLLEITDEIAARGGLLAWEETLYQDFATIFSKEAEVLGDRVKFIDGTFSGNDVRILKNAAGREVVMYGMLGNKVLITTNSRTFSDVANLIK